MTMGAYIGIDNTPRKVKKIYIGIDGEPRIIKKAYIGIGGVPRPCWNANSSGGTPTYYGAISDLYDTTSAFPGVAGDYVIFPAVSNSSEEGTAYNSSLTHVGLGSDEIGGGATHGFGLASTPNKQYAIYYGGFSGTGYTYYDYVYYYNSSLTLDSMLSCSESCASTTGATTDSHAVFAGGYNNDTDSPYAGICELYNNSMTASTHSTEDLFYVNMSGVSCGSKGAWFAGGEDLMSQRSEIWAVQSKQGDSYYVGEFDQGRTSLGGTKVGNYAIFGGGYPVEDINQTIEAFSMDGTKVTGCADLKYYYYYDTSVTTLGNYALFTGGFNSKGSTSSNFTNGSNAYVEIYDSSLTKQESLSIMKGWGTIVANGNNAFAAGRGESGLNTSVIQLV